MKLVALFVSLAAATEVLVEEGMNSQKTECRYPLCGLCGASEAYKLTYENAFKIEGYLLSSSEALRGMINDLSEYVEAEAFYVAIGKSNLCVETAQVQNNPDFGDMTKDLLQTNYNELLELEVFEANEKLHSVVGMAARGAYTTYSWKEFKIVWEAFDTRWFSNTLFLQLENITQTLTPVLQYEEYFGVASVGGIEEDFSMTPKDSSLLKVEVDGQTYSIENWLVALEKYENCGLANEPRGLDSYLKLFPIQVDFLLAKNSSEVFELYTSQILSGVPDFAVAPQVLLQSVSLKVSLPQNSTKCFLDFSAKWAKEKYLFDALLHASTAEDYFMEARFASDPSAISIGNLESFAQGLYSEPLYLVPKYLHNSSLTQKLYEVQLLNPVFTLYFLPETYLVAESTSEIIDEKDSSITLLIGRFHTVLECGFKLSQIQTKSLNYLVGQKTLSYEVVGSNSSVLSSTSQLNTSALGLPYNYFFEFGVHLNYYLEGLQEFSYFNISSVFMNSEYYPKNFKAQGELQPFEFANGLLIEDAEIIQYFEPYEEEFVFGYFEVVGDSLSVLEFAGNITSFDGEYLLKGVLQGTWDSAFEIDSLLIDKLTLDVKKLPDNTTKSISYGSAYFFYESTVWPGTAQVEFDLIVYEYNKLFLTMTSTDYQTFYGVILRVPYSNLGTTLKFPSGLQVNYRLASSAKAHSGFDIWGPVTFMGIPGEVSLNKYLYDSQFTVYVDLASFKFAHQNIAIRNQTEKELTARLAYTEEEVSGSLEMSVNMWGINQDSVMLLGDYESYFNITGNPFRGVYEFNLFVSIETSQSIREATTSVYSDLLEADSLQHQVNYALRNWVENGLLALELSENNIQSQKQRVSSISVCSEPCPETTLCTNNPQPKCLEYALQIKCLKNSTSCENISLSCSSFATYCLSSDTYCSEYDSSIPDECSKVETLCLEEVKTCEVWDQECQGQVLEPCEKFSFLNQESCRVTDFECESSTQPRPSCVSECQYSQERYTEESNWLNKLMQADKELKAALGGFEAFQSYSSLIEISKACMDLVIEKEGIGPEDLNLNLDFSFPNLEVSGYSSELVRITWDFYYPINNVNSLFYEAKKAIVTQNNLSTELIGKAPTEIYLELLN